MPSNFARRTRNFAMYTEYLSQHTDKFVLPQVTDGVETAWLCYPLTIRPDAGFARAALQEHLDGNEVDTRTVWTGNATRQPFMRGVNFVQPGDGLPSADAIMERGFILPLNHALQDEHIELVISVLETFLTRTAR